jgi:hypothetical protein
MRVDQPCAVRDGIVPLRMNTRILSPITVEISVCTLTTMCPDAFAIEASSIGCSIGDRADAWRIPAATVAINGARNKGLFAVEILPRQTGVFAITGRLIENPRRTGCGQSIGSHRENSGIVLKL